MPALRRTTLTHVATTLYTRIKPSNGIRAICAPLPCSCYTIRGRSVLDSERGGQRGIVYVWCRHDCHYCRCHILPEFHQNSGRVRTGRDLPSGPVAVVRQGAGSYFCF